MIEALLYFFARDERCLKEEVPVAANAATEAETAAGGCLEVKVTGDVKFHSFHDTVFFECRPRFVKGPFNTVTR